MKFNYETDPKTIKRENFRQIREITNLVQLDREQQQVAMRIVQSTGRSDIVQQLRFTASACRDGQAALAQNMSILCDAEAAKLGIKRRMISREPMCFWNDPLVPTLAASRGETRGMAALELWKPMLEGSVVVIGTSSTALFRLLEIIKQGAGKPALIIAMPAGFVGAAEAKQALWDSAQHLDLQCITLQGTEGGGSVAAACCNALLSCNYGEFY